MHRCITPLVADRRAADYDHSAITRCHEILPFYPFSAPTLPHPRSLYCGDAVLLAWQRRLPPCRTVVCLSSIETLTNSFKQCLFSIANGKKMAVIILQKPRMIHQFKTQRSQVLKWYKTERALDVYLRSRNKQKLCVAV